VQVTLSVWDLNIQLFGVYHPLASYFLHAMLLRKFIYVPELEILQITFICRFLSCFICFEETRML